MIRESHDRRDDSSRSVDRSLGAGGGVECHPDESRVGASSTGGHVANGLASWFKFPEIQRGIGPITWIAMTLTRRAMRRPKVAVRLPTPTPPREENAPQFSFLERVLPLLFSGAHNARTLFRPRTR